MDVLDVKKLPIDQLSTNTYDVTTFKNNQHLVSNSQLHDNLKFIHSQGRDYLPSHNLESHKIQDGVFSQKEKRFGFQNENTRKEFIKNVYSVLIICFIILFGIVSTFSMYPPARFWAEKNYDFGVIACCVLIAVFFVMFLMEKSIRTWHGSMIFLSMFTLAEGFLLGVISAVYNTAIVFMAIGLTIGVCLALILFAVQKDCDCTVYRSAVLALFVILVEIVPINMILDPPTLNLIFSSLCAIIFSFYLIYDTHLILDGKHEYSINPEEYIFAALIFCVDVINVPLHISRILCGSKIKKPYNKPGMVFKVILV